MPVHPSVDTGTFSALFLRQNVTENFPVRILISESENASGNVWRKIALKKSCSEIKRYTEEVKAAVHANRYRIEHSSRRPANAELYRNYLIDENRIKEILLTLSSDDFCKTLHNRHPGFEHEELYVYGKDVRLHRRFGPGEETVSLYIKINKLEDQFVIVVSFHRQAYPLSYAFTS